MILCCAALAVLVAGQWFVRRELRTRSCPPPALLLWLVYAGVAVVVIFGAVRTSWVVLT